MDDHLLGWLKSMNEDRLARVLANRPDAIAAPWPRRLDTLAQRLGNGPAVLEALRGLPLPCLELADACLILGEEARPSELARLLGVRDEDIRPWLDRLTDHALAWPDADGRIRLATALAQARPTPCGLGRPLAHYLGSWTISTEALRALGTVLGLPAHGPKRRVAARVTDVLTDPARVAALLRGAPEGTAALLAEFAWD